MSSWWVYAKRAMTDQLSGDALVDNALSEEAFSNKLLHDKLRQTDCAWSVI